MLSVKIANKLQELYCSKSQDILDVLKKQHYGVECGEKTFPKDGNIKIMLLEYIYQFKGDILTNKLEEFPCLNKIIHE